MKSNKKKNENIKPRTFEECIDIINACINKRRHRWTLSALAYLDFNDVAQNLRLHIWKKWYLYDQNKKLETWLTVVINHQMINMIRNVYGNFSRPCLKCEFYEGEDSCKKFGIVSNKCDLYKTWNYGKKTKHDIQLSLPIENHANEIKDIRSENIDVDRTAKNIHEKMKTVLKKSEWQVYDLLFIQNKTEEEAGKILEYKSNEKNRNAGYKQIANIRKNIITKVKDILSKEEIEIVH
jgi:hypothetical protein